MATHPVHPDPRQHLGLARDELDPPSVVEQHELGERFGQGEGAVVLVLARDAGPELELLALNPERAAGEVGIAAPVIPVQMRDQRHRHLGRLDANPREHLRRAHEGAQLLEPGVGLGAARVHDDGVRSAQDDPDVEVESQRLLGGLAKEELAFLGFALSILQRVDLVLGGH